MTIIQKYVSEASVFQAQVDNDMRLFEEHKLELETEIDNMEDGLVKAVLSTMVVQLYLNEIKRTLDEFAQG